MNKINNFTGRLSVQNGEQVQAHYTKQSIPMYCNNPLIEALPPILSREEVIGRLGYYPAYSPKERLSSPEERIHRVDTAKLFFQPMTNSVLLERCISMTIRSNYVGRDHEIQKGFFWKNLERKLNSAHWDDSIGQSKSNSSGTALIGPSGTGKTITTRRILKSFYPQVIHHTQYKGEAFDVQQVVWLNLECPADGSLKGLILNFFLAMDDILGTEYYESYTSKGKISAENMRPYMARVAAMHGLGVLIIDESQNLKEAASGGDKKMLNFLVSIENTIGVPVLLIGTNKVINVLIQNEFRHARRMSGEGNFIWDLMENNNEWNLFLKSLWRYQYTQNKCDLTKELIDTMYEESGGIPDVAVKIYRTAQVIAIDSGKEVINKRLIRDTARLHFPLLAPVLKAIHGHDTNKLQRYEDIYSGLEDIPSIKPQSNNNCPDPDECKNSVSSPEAKSIKSRSNNRIMQNNQESVVEIYSKSFPRDPKSIAPFLQIIKEKSEKNINAYDALIKTELIGL